MDTNCYVLAAAAGQDAVIIDPGADAGKIEEVLRRHSLRPALIINTHGHYDHIGEDDHFDAPVIVHADDAGMLVEPRRNFSAVFGIAFKVKKQVKHVKDGDSLSAGGVVLRVLHTPGHTAGGISLLVEKPAEHIVFTGDALFAGSIGRTDLGGSEEQLLKSVRAKLLSLPDDTVVYPGHGPATTIGEERMNNPFLQE